MEQSQKYRGHWEDSASAGPPPAELHDGRHSSHSVASERYDNAGAADGGCSRDSSESAQCRASVCMGDDVDSCNSWGSEQHPDNRAHDAVDDSRDSWTSERCLDLHGADGHGDNCTSSGSERNINSRGGFDARDGCHGHESCDSEASAAIEAGQAAHSEASADSADTTGAIADDHHDGGTGTASIDRAACVARDSGSASGAASDGAADIVVTVPFAAKRAQLQDASDSDAATDNHYAAVANAAEAAAARPRSPDSMPARLGPQRLYLDAANAHALFHRNPGVCFRTL